MVRRGQAEPLRGVGEAPAAHRGAIRAMRHAAGEEAHAWAVKPEDFEIDLEKRIARHRLCGTTFLFYNYESFGGLRPHLVRGHGSSEWPWQELAEPATKAFHGAEKRRAGR